jgi:transcriptional regulator with XRE-family HTH domain
VKIISGQQVNQLFRNLRLHADMSVAGLARRLRVAGSTIHERERGAAKSLSVDALVAAADVFGLDVVLIRRDTGKPA